jgi:hypothetical protein
MIVLGHHTRDGTDRARSAGVLVDFPREAEAALDRRLAAFGRRTWELTGSLSRTLGEAGFSPWAVITFPAEYRLAGHLLARQPAGGGLYFTAYSARSGYSVQAAGPPPVSVVLVARKSLLQALAGQTELLAGAWFALRDRSEAAHWLCLADAPPAGWLEAMSAGDDELFWSLQ